MFSSWGPRLTHDEVEAQENQDAPHVLTCRHLQRCGLWVEMACKPATLEIASDMSKLIAVNHGSNPKAVGNDEGVTPMVCAWSQPEALQQHQGPGVAKLPNGPNEKHAPPNILKP